MTSPDTFPTLADVHGQFPRCVRCGELIPTPEDAAHDVRPARLKHATEEGCRAALVAEIDQGLREIEQALGVLYLEESNGGKAA